MSSWRARAIDVRHSSCARHAPEAVVGEPSPVEDLGRVDVLPPPGIGPELVSDGVVRPADGLHPRGVDRPQLRAEPTRAGQDAGERVPVEGRPVGDELEEVEGRLPRIWTLLQRVAAGQIGRDLPAVGQRPHDLERHHRGGLRQPPHDPEDRRDADRLGRPNVVWRERRQRAGGRREGPQGVDGRRLSRAGGGAGGADWRPSVGASAGIPGRGASPAR